MAKIIGNIDKALGVGKIKLKDDLIIDISDIKASDIIDYQKIIARKYDDNEKRIEDIKNYFSRILADPEQDQEKLELLIAVNLGVLINEFGIATGLISKEQSEQIKKAQEEELKKLSLEK
jgi:hypothetical protein